MTSFFPRRYADTVAPVNTVNPVNIILNGEPFELKRPVTVSKLLEQLNIDPRRVAVEHNLVVLKRAAYDSTLLKEGDEVEVVNFVGGGTSTSDL